MFKRLKLLLLLSFLPLVISGCASSTIREIGLDKLAPRKAEQELSIGINNYDQGNYQTAARYLQNAIRQKLTFKSDEVTARKYLAFIYCVTEREKLCAEEFRQAFILDPQFQLSGTEIGHPIWGPVYRRVKEERSMTRRK